MHIEVDGPDDEIEFAGPGQDHDHLAPPARPGRVRRRAGRGRPRGDIPDGARVWVACEAAAMRDIRRYFIRERDIPVVQLVTRGYWRAGEQNHPDHDYGED